MNKIIGVFPIPLYITERDLNLDSTEKKEIESIIKEGVYQNGGTIFRAEKRIVVDPILTSTPGSGTTLQTSNTYVFNTRLHNLKEFCEKHIKNYVKEVIKPKEELDFYITQSWLNVNKPGDSHQPHSHQNSIISGVFYVATVEDDRIYFYDPLAILKDRTFLEKVEFTQWNSTSWNIPIEKNYLILFPSWLVHSVERNEKQTTDRISLSFNVYAKGIFGAKDSINELIL